MSRENVIWLAVFLIGAAALAGRAMLTPDGMGKAYVKEVPKRFVQVDVPPDPAQPDAPTTEWKPYDPQDPPGGLGWEAVPTDRKRSWTIYENSTYRGYLEGQAAGAAAPAGAQATNPYQFSVTRTIGIWLAAFFTLAVLSFLIKDNPFYKIAESVFVGVSAAYWMVVGFWSQLVPNLIGKISPDLIRNWAVPGLSPDAERELLYLVPLILGIMLLWRLAPRGGWISRWPMAFFIGTFCGLRLIAFLHGDFLNQIRNAIVSLWGENLSGGFDFWESLKALILVVGVLACLVYFFFSIEHKGAVGKTARVGIWFLMITFGAAFGYTVMGRIALLAIRIEFLFDDWLWLIDPTDRRNPVALLLLPWMG